MRPYDLWALMVDITSRCLQATAVESPEDILDDVLESCITLDHEELALVRETVSGTLHFTKVSEGMLNGYCDCLRRNRTDKFAMYLIAHLVVFRYTTLGGHQIRELLYRSISTPRLVEYLEYMLNPQSLMTYSKPYWSEHYDERFIDSGIFCTLAEISPHVKKDVIHWLLGKTAARVVGVEVAEDDQEQRVHATKPMPCKKGDQALLMTERAPQRHRATLPPVEVRDMLYTIPEKRQPRIDCSKPPRGETRRCKSPTKPVGFSFMARQPKHLLKEEEHPACQVENASQRIHRQLPRKVPDSVQVRMTNAALRREATVYLRQREEQKRTLSEIEAALRDSKEFEEWQRQGREQETQERAEEFLNRRAQIKCAADNASRERKAVEEKKKAVSAQVRADLASRMESCDAEKQKGFVKRFRQASKLRQELVEKRRKAVNRLQQERFSSAVGVRMENEELREVALEEDEKVKAQRLLMIQEIRQLRERNQRRREDLAERNIHEQNPVSEDTTYHGFSVATLREELRRLKEANAQAEEERRIRYRALRQQEREKLDALSRICSIGRKKAHRLREEERSGRRTEKAALLARKEEVEVEHAAEVCSALKQRRKERLAEHHALMREDKNRMNRLLLLSKDTPAMEENYWSQREHCVINRLTASQNERHRSGFL